MSNKNNLVLATILGLIFISYSFTLKNGFTNWDDDVHVTENFYVRHLSFDSIKNIFTTEVLKLYIPLTQFSFSIEYHFFKDNPFIYHLDNLLLHLAVVWMVYFLARRLGLDETPATLASFLFGIHPMHVESVAWVTERKDVLYAFFYMLSLLSYTKYQEGRKGHYSLSILFGILSMLAKPMALSLPIVMVILDWFRGRKINAQTLLEKWPHAVYVGLITWQSYKNHIRIPGGDQSLVDIALTWIWSLTFYIKHFFFPAEVVPLYHLPKPVGLQNPEFLLAIFIAIALGMAIFKFRKDRWFMLGLLLFFGMIFFLLRFDDLKDENVVADRFMYLPSIGLCWWVGYVVAEALKKGTKLKHCLIVIVMGSVLGLLSIKTFTLTTVWKDSLTLWEYVIEKYPDNYTAYLNRADAYNKLGEYRLSKIDLEKVLKLNPDNAIANNNYGMAIGMEGDFKKALGYFLRAVALDPEYYQATTNAAEAYRLMGKYVESLALLEKSLAINPNYIPSYRTRGYLYEAIGLYEKAVGDFKTLRALGFVVPQEYLDALQKKLNKNE